MVSELVSGTTSSSAMTLVSLHLSHVSMLSTWQRTQDKWTCKREKKMLVELTNVAKQKVERESVCVCVHACVCVCERERGG